MRATMIRQVLLLATALLSVLLVFSISACGNGTGEEKQAEGYYEGPMRPKGSGSLGQSEGTK